MRSIIATVAVGLMLIASVVIAASTPANFEQIKEKILAEEADFVYDMRDPTSGYTDYDIENFKIQLKNFDQISEKGINELKVKWAKGGLSQAQIEELSTLYRSSGDQMKEAMAFRVEKNDEFNAMF